jgi:FtsP/CotA-like multicopper oxidase with cupredoxin domain
MTPATRRAFLVAGVALVAIGGFMIASRDDKKTTTTSAKTATSTNTSTSTTPIQARKPKGPPIHTVNVVGGKPAGGVKKIKVNKGDTVRLLVKSDVADEIHVHGYDVKKQISAGGTAAIQFKATIDGSFEIELEGRKEQIAQLTVQP